MASPFAPPPPCFPLNHYHQSRSSADSFRSSSSLPHLHPATTATAFKTSLHQTLFVVRRLRPSKFHLCGTATPLLRPPPSPSTSSEDDLHRHLSPSVASSPLGHRRILSSSTPSPLPSTSSLLPAVDVANCSSSRSRYCRSPSSRSLAIDAPLPSCRHLPPFRSDHLRWHRLRSHRRWSPLLVVTPFRLHPPLATMPSQPSAGRHRSATHDAADSIAPFVILPRHPNPVNINQKRRREEKSRKAAS